MAGSRLDERLDRVLSQLVTVGTMRELLRVHAENCVRGDDCPVAKSLRRRMRRMIAEAAG